MTMNLFSCPPSSSIRYPRAFALSVLIRYLLFMNKRTWFCIFLIVLAGLNLGTVRKTQDPIRDTQTDGILYEQKKEEEKDGKKGPLMYHVRNNPRESFFIDPPFSKEEKSTGELITAKSPVSQDTAGWWEEQPTEVPAVPEPSRSPEAFSEEWTESEGAQEDVLSRQSEASREVKETGTAKEDEYWW